VFPILRALAHHGKVLWIFTGIDQHRLLLRLLDELPVLASVLNHMGAVPLADGVSAEGRPRLVFPTGGRRRQLRELAAHPEMRVILSGQYAISNQKFPYSDLRSHTDFLLTEFGPDRLLWGSDYPFVGSAEAYGEQLAWVRWVLPGASERELSAILGGNARRLGASERVPSIDPEGGHRFRGDE
jgi:L-fuconolactonase